ncbi:uncharacterized protein LOC107044849 [Diachasma alloeum]|uniref:uncharacterized protein LOC107044849 n=1 Tax=Diachasma alloeum TaxID=454923 RepID=UPI00073830EB|nr:uncharacterized protein LOC107044849 [Diachasma alloeum]
MLRKTVVVLLLLLLVMNIDGGKSKIKKRESLFSKVRLITHATMDLYRILKTIMSHSGSASILLSELFDWFTGDDTHGHDLNEVNTKLTDISSQLNWIMMRMEANFAILERTISQLPLAIEVDNIKRELAMTIRKIKNLYDVALGFSSDISRHNGVELQNVANTLTGRQAGDLRDSLSKLYDYIVPVTAQNLKQSFLDLLNHDVQAKDENLCGDQSPNQYLYQLHKIVVATEMMGQVALTFGYYLQHQLNNVTIDTELQQAQEERQERLKNYFRKFKSSMNDASLSSRPCDRENLIRDKTFFEMEKLYQAVLVEDYNLNNNDSCKGTCDTIDVPMHRNDNDGVLCTRLDRCWILETAQYCIQPHELRRYEWIEDQRGGIYGVKNGCQGQQLATPGWWKGLYECENCICTCVGGHKERMATEIQAFSLRVSRSNITENMVVTGIKFSRHESIICIQIKEGKLLPGGEIEKNSQRWTDCDLSYSSYRLARFGTSDYVHGTDFVLLNRSYNYIDLDDIIEHQDSIVTGVKFGLTSSCAGEKHVKLQLEYTKFNFSSGELTSRDGSRSSSTCHNQKINIADTDSPLNQNKPRDQNTVDSGSNTYVSFGWSSFKRDVGQTTLPLLDAQPVETNPPAPLSGAGLFHKSSPGYGGFLALKINTLNYGRYMEDEITEGYIVGSVGKVLPPVNGKAVVNPIHAFDQQTKETDDNSSSYSPYITFLVMPLFVFAGLYIFTIYKKWQNNARPIIVLPTISSDERVRLSRAMVIDKSVP